LITRTAPIGVAQRAAAGRCRGRCDDGDVRHGVSMSSDLVIGAHRYPGDVILQAQYSRVDDQRWLVDVGSVRWLVDRVAAGDITGPDAQEWLRQATSWESGCCDLCDRATGTFADAQRRTRELFDRFDAEQRALTAESHPYLLNKTVAHAWDCRNASVRRPGDYTTSLHLYAVQLDGMGSLDHVLRRAWEPTTIARRLTADEMLAWLERRSRAARDPRCKRCSPPLPGAYRSEASGVEATAAGHAGR